MKIKTALISVSDKTGLPELANALAKRQITVYSTGGTLKSLRDAGLQALDVSDLTGSPEILGGRVKTLHPSVHAGILADNNNPSHLATLAKLNIPTIDLVVVNFYPFEQAAAQASENGDSNVVENIDIGGPTMVRAAAKNCDSTIVLTDPQDYPAFIGEMEKSGGDISQLHARMLAAKAFVAVAHLDAAIANYYSARYNGGGEADSGDGAFPLHHFFHLHKQMDLKYGENPHQQAACYEMFGNSGGYIQLQGAPLSYNNLLDASAACELVSLMNDEPAAAIIKHNNPSGVAVADDIRQAFFMARRCDTVSAFGGVVAVNREVTGPAAEAMTDIFLEAVLAPQFSPEAKEVFAARAERIRLLLSPNDCFGGGAVLRGIGGLYLMQSGVRPDDRSQWQVVTEHKPTESQLKDLHFAWRTASVVKSNAIVIAKDGATLGIGAGQMSRIDSARLACDKAKRAKLKLDDSVAASDAFFPFTDGLDALVADKVCAVVQPGGSKNDAEVIAAADKAGIAMVFTGVRCFRH